MQRLVGQGVATDAPWPQAQVSDEARQPGHILQAEVAASVARGRLTIEL
jgi:hypothetical protein